MHKQSRRHTAHSLIGDSATPDAVKFLLFLKM